MSPVRSTDVAADIAALEACLAQASTPKTEALAENLAARLARVRASDPAQVREEAVRGLLVANHQFYRTGDLRRCGEMLRSALALSTDLGAEQRLLVLLRCGEFDMLRWDVGSALQHTVAAMDLARESRHPVEEARALVNYGMALDFAGLYEQADGHWSHALALLEGSDEARLKGNIWALRSPLGFRLNRANAPRADDICREALAWALASPPRYRDSMACTALCNWAALDLQRGRVEAALARLDEADAFPNLGVRPRWLIAVLRAMAAIRQGNDEASRAALDGLLAAPDAPAAAYVIETIAVLAAMYVDMGDATRAGEALERLSTERARALWAMLRDVRFAAGSPAQPAATDEVTALLERLAVTAELRDDATGKHCYRVGRLSMLLARAAGLPEGEVEALDLAARLHDIGKIVIPDAILLKPGPLDRTELHLMRSHTSIGADILSSGAFPVPPAAHAIARHHHERWDGSGYPDGLAGEAIPRVARIAALADVYDALTHERPYKRAWSHEESMAYIVEQAGTQFDPALVPLFVQMMGPAAGDLAAFLRDAEIGAASSSYVEAQQRVARAA